MTISTPVSQYPPLPCLVPPRRPAAGRPAAVDGRGRHRRHLRQLRLGAAGVPGAALVTSHPCSQYPPMVPGAGGQEGRPAVRPGLAGAARADEVGERGDGGEAGQPGPQELPAAAGGVESESYFTFPSKSLDPFPLSLRTLDFQLELRLPLLTVADLSRLVLTALIIKLICTVCVDFLTIHFTGHPGPPQHQGLRHARRLPQLRGGAVPRRAHGRHAHLLRPVRQRRGDREPWYLLYYLLIYNI